MGVVLHTYMYMYVWCFVTDLFTSILMQFLLMFDTVTLYMCTSF